MNPLALSTGRIVAIGAVLAAVLALTVAGQLYLSMYDHGHSFARMYVAELMRWLFWPLAAPPVLRAGAALMRVDPAAPRPVRRVVRLAVVLIVLHFLFSLPFIVWLRPLGPMQISDDWFVVAQNQMSTWVPTDLMLFAGLLVVGHAAAVSGRARALELRELRLETDLARAQLDALRLEIQPHFLFNTLNSIAAQIRLGDNPAALKMLLGLSDLMRMTVDRPKQHLVPLSAEIDFLQCYVDLQQTRFADRLQVEYRIGEECRSVAVPSLLLQPLVENAIRHGLNGQAQRCRVQIGARCDGNRLQLWVSDDGAGLPQGFDLNQHAGTGLRNTQSRLRQIYGTAAAFVVRPHTPAGTLVEMTVPVQSAPALLRQPA
jgi:two-component system, LytTR family, sensor kinase